LSTSSQLQTVETQAFKLKTMPELSKRAKAKSCELCQRPKPLSFHHLIPKKNHKRNAFSKRFSKEDMLTRGLWLCCLCHNKLHKTFSEKELGQSYNTLEAIKAQPEISHFLEWAKKQK
jgi:hypothetical protein